MNSVSTHHTRRDKPQLVLLAGLLCDRTVWDEVASRLTDLARITVIDFPNFATIESMAEHVLNKAPPRFILVGHSMGGRVALEVVRKAAGRVRAIGLFNTGVHPVAAHEPTSRGELVQLAHAAGMHAVAERWLPPMLDGNGTTSADLYARLVAMVERSSPEGFARQTAALLTRPDATAVLSSLDVPTLLLSASGDRWSPVAQHQEMRRLVPQAELVVIQDAGHMALVEQPAAVATALHDWIVALRPLATS